MSKRQKWIVFGAWLVCTIIVFVGMHQFELSSIASDPEAEQRFKGYGAFIAGGYNVYRVGAVTLFGAAVSYWVLSFLMKSFIKMTAAKTAEKKLRQQSK